MHREREKMYANHFEHVNNRKSTMLTIVSGITNILFLSTLERPSPEFWWKTIDLLGRVKSKMWLVQDCGSLKPNTMKVAANVAAYPTPPRLQPMLLHAQYHKGCSQNCSMPKTTEVAANVHQGCSQHCSMPNTTNVAANVAACPTPPTLRPTLQHAQHYQGCSQHCSMPHTINVAANIAACPTPPRLQPTLQHAQQHQGWSQRCSMPNTTKVAANTAVCPTQPRLQPTLQPTRSCGSHTSSPHPAIFFFLVSWQKIQIWHLYWPGNEANLSKSIHGHGTHSVRGLTA